MGSLPVGSVLLISGLRADIWLARIDIGDWRKVPRVEGEQRHLETVAAAIKQFMMPLP